MLENNIDGWRYACPICGRVSIFQVRGKTCEIVPSKWWGVLHYRCTNGHRFLTPVDNRVIA